MAARDDVQSESWRKFISAKIEFILVYSNSTQQLNVIASLLDDEALLPPNSPARRWALLTAAEYYAKLGEATAALALRKQVSQMPLPADTAHLLSSSNDPAALEKAAFDLGMLTDLPAQARLLERAIELRRDAKTLADAAGRVAVSVLVELKSEIGESQDIQHYIDAYYDAVTRQELAPPPDERLALDQPLIETIAGLETFTDTLSEIGTGTDYGSAIQTIRDAIVTIRKNRLRTVLRLTLSGGKSVEDAIMQADLGVSNIADIKGPAFAMATYGEVVFPVLFGPGTDSRPWTDWNVLNLFQLIARSLHSAGADFPAGKLYLAHADLLYGSEPKWTAQGVCVDLANTMAGALADASFARWRGALRLPCKADVPTATPTATEVAINWPNEQLRLKATTVEPEIVDRLRVGTGPVCPMTGSEMIDDRLRRAALALLDEATVQGSRSANSQAQRLESLASLYDPRATDVPITLRRTALDLQIASPEASPSRIGESLGCLVRDLTLQGNKDLVNPLMIEVQKRMAGARGANAAQQTFDAAESMAHSKAPELPSIEILEQRTPGLGDPSAADWRRRLIDIVQQLRHYKAARNDKARVRSLWERLTAIAVQGSSPPGALAGLVYSANAEYELLFGSISEANRLIAKAIPTVDSPEWRESDVMIEARGALLNLRNFSARISENKGRLQEALTELKDIQTQLDKSPGDVAEALVSVITAAISDYDYATVLTSFDRLSKLKIGFSDPGFLTRDNLEQYLSELAFSCQSNGVTEGGVGDTWVGINECATTAMRMTALIAEDELQKIATSSESEDRTRSRQQPNTTLLEIVTDIGPLVNQVDDVGDELGKLLRWLVAIRTPPIAGAELERVESLRPASGSEEFQRRLDDWRRVGGGWLQAESRYRCAQLSSHPPSNLRSLAQAAESARNSTRSAWAALTGTLPDGALILPYSELKVEELKASLSAEEAILSYVVVDKEILIWVVRRDGVSLRLSGADRLNENIESLLGAITKPPAAVGQTLDLGPAQRVYNQLIAPVADLLTDVQSLFVDGDQITTRVPFSALVGGGTVSADWSPSAGWTPEWLGKRFSISLVPSLASFARGRVVPVRPSGEILAAGDPVRIGVPVDPSAWCQKIVTGASGQPPPPLLPAPGADAELQTVMRLAGPRGHPLSAESFSSAELRPASFARFGMMVFATHGEQETATYPAGLVLSGFGPEKNRLTSEDLPSLSINADIVVLSACDSGMANGRGGLNSLMAGFIRAGARQVVATGWTTGMDVQAITASLVQQYVAVGARNMDRVLQSAVKAMMVEEIKRQLRHPFFWAGIFLLGSSAR